MNDIYIYIYNMVNNAINRIDENEKAFRLDLSRQIKNTSPFTNYFLRITFFCYLFLFRIFVRSAYDFFFHPSALVLISHSAFSLCTVNDKYNNYIHISTKINNS